MWKEKINQERKKIKMTSAPKDFYRKYRVNKIADAKFLNENLVQSLNGCDDDAIRVC